MDDGSNLLLVAAIRAQTTIVMRACNWVTFCTISLGSRKSFVGGSVWHERVGRSAQSRTPWNPPGTTAPNGQAEEQQTA